MLFVNQNDYPDIPYPTDIDHPDSSDNYGTIETAGCGLCSAVMMVDRLCMKGLNLEECRDISVECGANREPGTDMKILGPVLADKFHLAYKETSNTGELIEWLQGGGAAIINPGGDQEGYVGLFTHSGHYIFADSFSNGEFMILDPSWSEEKFKTPERAGRVREAGCIVYATPEAIIRDTENRRPRYHLFARKDDTV